MSRFNFHMFSLVTIQRKNGWKLVYMQKYIIWYDDTKLTYVIDINVITQQTPDVETIL